MPPQSAFNAAFGNRNNRGRVAFPPTMTRRNRVNMLLKAKPTLKRQNGSRNLMKKHGLQAFGFSNNTKKNNQNTRGLAKPRQWPANLQEFLPNVRAQPGMVMNALTQEKFNAMDPNEQSFMESISRFSEPGSKSYTRPYAKGNFGPKEAKMMANLTAQYNNPADMMVAVEGLNLNNSMKRKFMMNIASMYRNFNNA